MGRVEALAPASRLDLAIALAEQADRPAEYPGLGLRETRRFRLIVASDQREWERLTHGRLPPRGAGAPAQDATSARSAANVRWFSQRSWSMSPGSEPISASSPSGSGTRAVNGNPTGSQQRQASSWP